MVAMRRFGSRSTTTSWAVLAVPGLLLVMLLIFYVMANTVERPAEMSIARSDKGNSSTPPSAAGSTAPIPVVPLVVLGVGLIAIVGVIVGVNSKPKRPEISPSSRRPASFSPTPAPVRAPAAVRVEPTKNGETVECPQCAETIKRKALVCRFCGFKLEEFVDRPKSFSADDPGRTESAD